jgi:hypothetical protein
MSALPPKADIGRLSTLPGADIRDAKGNVR